MGGGGGYSLIEVIQVCAAARGRFLGHFGLKTGVDFLHFGLESGMVFKGTTLVRECIRPFNSI